MNTGNDKLPSTVHVQDIARALGCHDQTVRRMVRNGDLPKPMRIGRGRPFWPAFEIEAALKRTTTATVVPLEMPPLHVIGKPVTDIPGAPDSPIPMISKAA